MKNFYTLFFTILLLLVLISTGYYFTVYKADEDVVSNESLISQDPLQKLNQQLLDIEIKKNFWNNKIKLADQDQFNIFIDLSDSIATLEASGITAHSAPISNFEISENFDLLKKNESIIRFLRNPFNLIEAWASVPKNPIRVKDISGYKWNPDSLNFVPTKIDTEFVFIVLKCSKELSVMISQRAIIGEMPAYIISDHITRFKNVVEINKKSAELPFSELLQTYWIGIEIPRSDAIALYRAFTENSLFVVCF